MYTQKPTNCDCCNKEFSFSDLAQEVNSVYRFKDFRWICDDCAKFANKKVDYARTISLDIQKNIVINAIQQRKQQYNSSTVKPIKDFNPSKVIMNKLFILTIMYILVSYGFYMLLTWLLLTEPVLKALGLVAIPFLIFSFISFKFANKATDIVGTLIADNERKATNAIDAVIELANETNFINSKDSSTISREEMIKAEAMRNSFNINKASTNTSFRAANQEMIKKMLGLDKSP